MYPFQSTDPRDARFLSFPGINFNDPGVQLAGLAGLGVAALAAGNVINGNDDLKIRPNLGVNYGKPPTITLLKPPKIVYL